MEFAGVHHVSLNVRDVDEARAFYVETLGLAEIARPDLGFAGLWLQIGAQELHLMESADAPSRGQHFALRVADLDRALSELASRGLEPRTFDAPDRGRQCFFRDPSGNLIELHQPRP